MRALLAAISCAMAAALNPGVVLGLNGALQRRVAFDAPLAVGAVNRASESHCARIAAAMASPVSPP